MRATFADHSRDALGWESIHAQNEKTSGPNAMLGRENGREAVLVRDGSSPETLAMKPLGWSFAPLM